jgi:DNA-binding NarL/FixJ family response regulator
VETDVGAVRDGGKTCDLSADSIAETLSISYRTVTNHVASILAKLEASSRTAAATFAVRRGLV